MPTKEKRPERAALQAVGETLANRSYVLCLPPLGSFNDGELNRLAFLQAAETVRLDRREMHENVFAILAADKPVAFCVIEPLHCSLFHVKHFLLVKFAGKSRGTAGR